MQMVSEVMTRNVRFVSPQESLQQAAQLMDELNVGVLPVCAGETLVGMVTDRDITVRGVAAGKEPGDAHVNEVMSKDVHCVYEDQPLDDVMIQMADSQIRRIPVVSHDAQRKLLGIVSLADVVNKTAGGAPQQDVKEVVQMVSSPDESGRPKVDAKDLAGRAVDVTPGAAATGTDSAGMAGTDIPRAGESGAGMAGASGEPKTKAPGGKEPDAGTGDARRNFGVGGGDLTGGGLPPA